MDEYKDLLEEDTLKGKYLTFKIGNEEYGIAISYVKEIIGIQKITPVPKIPNYIKGIINLRGLIVPVMDVRLRLGQDFREYDDRTCIIVIETNGILAGLIVDHVSEVVSIEDEEISSIPDGFSQKYFMGIAKMQNKVKLLIDCESLLNNDLSLLEEIA